MINYSVSTEHSLYNNGGKIEFWTDSDELYENVARYINTCVDASSWRNRVEKVTVEREQENE